MLGLTGVLREFSTFTQFLSMKKISINITLLLLTLMSVLSGCSKNDVTPGQPNASAHAQDAVVTAFLVKSYLFVRTPGPFGLGHTALAYEVREMSGSTVSKVYTYCGGVENPGGQPNVAAGADNGGWLNYDLNSNVAMLNRMRGRGYTAYKFEVGFRNVAQSTLTNASNILHNFPYRGYSVFNNNCSNATYEVLSSLGAPGLAQPTTNWAPLAQYNKTTTGWSGSNTL